MSNTRNSTSDFNILHFGQNVAKRKNINPLDAIGNML